MLEKIKSDKNLEVKSEHIEAVKQIKEMFSTFVEVEVKFNDLKRMLQFCFDYMPSSIEILDSENITFKAKEFSSSLNDMLMYMHRYHASLSSLNAENEVLKRKLNASSGK